MDFRLRNRKNIALIIRRYDLLATTYRNILEIVIKFDGTASADLIEEAVALAEQLFAALVQDHIVRHGGSRCLREVRAAAADLVQIARGGLRIRRLGVQGGLGGNQIHFRQADQLDIHGRTGFFPIAQSRGSTHIFVAGSLTIEALPFLYRFINSHRDTFDYQKLNGNWNSLNDLSKLIWLKKHLIVESFEHNVYVFSFNVEASDPHDYDYVKDNAARFLDAYVEFARRECSKAGIGELVMVERVELIPDSTTVTRRQLVFKHAIIGAVIGLLVGLIVVFGLSKRAATHG